MKGLIDASASLGLGEIALLIADHMPPLPLELIVMLECACCGVRVKRACMGMRSMCRTCCVLGNEVSDAK